MTDTGNNPAPNHASSIAATKATAPDTGDPVACVIVGNVITASVTYGT